MTAFDLVKFALMAYLVGIASYFALAIGHFNRESDARVTLKLVMVMSLAVTVLTVIEVIRSHPSAVRLALTFAIGTVSLVIFRSAIRAIQRKNLGLAFGGSLPDEIAVDGPYRFIRHPLYTSYCLFWLGCAALGNTIVLWCLSTAICAMYYMAASSEEKNLMGSELRSGYEAYRARTGLIVPKIFSWQR